ncbi:MAG: chorismate mutase [bacterium]
MNYKVMRGVRGATVARENKQEEIVNRTEELLQKMVEANNIITEDIGSVLFSVTTDLNAEFPAVAARRLGWMDVPLICFTEIPVPGSLGKCIRVMINLNTEQKQNQIHHIYLYEAEQLRPDKSNK